MKLLTLTSNFEVNENNDTDYKIRKKRCVLVIKCPIYAQFRFDTSFFVPANSGEKVKDIVNVFLSNWRLKVFLKMADSFSPFTIAKR